MFLQPAHQRRDVAVRDPDRLGAGLLDGLQQRGPIGVIGEHEAAVQRAPAARAPDAHPARGEGRGGGAEAAQPCRPLGERRRHDQRFGVDRSVRRQRQGDSLRPVDGIDPFHRLVKNQGAGAGVEHRQNALRLAHRVREQNAGAPRLPVRAPPVLDLRDGLRGIAPAEDRQAEGRFGDERVAAHRLERRAGGVGSEFVVARDHPDFAAAFDANLRGPEDVSGRMEGDADLSDADRGAVGLGLDCGVVIHARPQQGLSRKRGQIGARTAAGVVAMSVSNQRAIDGEGRVDMEIPGRAVQAGFANLQKRHMLIVLRPGSLPLWASGSGTMLCFAKRWGVHSWVMRAAKTATPRLVDVDAANFDALPCCGIKNPTHPGRQEKRCWLRANAEFGLRAKALLAPDGRPAGYIEYIPGEFAWRGVDAGGYMFVHCIWIYSRQHQRKGWGRLMLEACLDDAKQAGRNGVAVMVRQGQDFCAVSYCSRILCMPRGNPSPKLAITIDPDIHENILAAAARDGVSVSAWMTIAAREALQRRAGLAAVALWEKQHGRFTPEEMNEARRNVRAQLRTSRTVRRPA